MAGNKISTYSDITTLASGDKIPTVDVSDTSQGAGGTTKYSTPAEMATFIKNNPASGTVKTISIQVIDGATTLTTGDGKAYLRVPADLHGYNITNVAIQVIVTSTSGTPQVQIARGRQSSATSDFTYSDVLSTRVTIDENEYDSKDATTAMVVNTSNDDLATGDVLRVDVDTAGTGTKGLQVTITCTLP